MLEWRALYTKPKVFELLWASVSSAVYIVGVQEQ